MSDSQQAVPRDRIPPVVEVVERLEAFCSSCGADWHTALVMVRAPHTERNHFKFCPTCIAAMAKAAEDIPCP